MQQSLSESMDSPTAAAVKSSPKQVAKSVSFSDEQSNQVEVIELSSGKVLIM
jgi:hypothetical protein